MNLLDVLQTVDTKKILTTTKEYKDICEYDNVVKKYTDMVNNIINSVESENIEKRLKTFTKKKANGILENISTGVNDKKYELQNNLFKNYLTIVDKADYKDKSYKNRISLSPKTNFGFLKELAEKFKMVIIPLDYCTNISEKLTKNQNKILSEFVGDCFSAYLSPYILAPIEYYDHWKHLNCDEINQFTYFPECYQDVKLVLDIQMLSQKNTLTISKTNSQNIKMIKSNVDMLQSKLGNLEDRVLKLEKDAIIKKQEEIKKLELAKAEEIRKARINKDPLVFAIPHDTPYYLQDRTDNIKRNIIVKGDNINDETIAVTNICFGEDFEEVFAHYYGMTHYKKNRETIETNLEKIYL